MEPINNHGYHLRDVTGSTSIDTDTYSYDANGNLVSHNGRSYTWTSDNLPSRLTIPNLADEHYTYDADGERLTRTVNGVTTVYLAGLWEEEIPTGVSRSHYALQAQIVAQRSSSPSAVLYLHRDHLGSVSAATDASGLLVSKQDFTPWGEIRGGGSGMTETSLNYTGQRRDSTGLLFYHARYYDPNLGRFLSADTVVPGAPDGSMDGTLVTPLTVSFHEGDLLATLITEAQSVANSDFSPQRRDRSLSHSGPANAQALNRYSYVQNNPINYDDPTGHVRYNRRQAAEVKRFLKEEGIPALKKIRDDTMSQLGATGAIGGAALGVCASLPMLCAAAGAAAGIAVSVGVGAAILEHVDQAIDIFEWMEAEIDYFLDIGADSIEFQFYVGRDGSAQLQAIAYDAQGRRINRQPHAKEVPYWFIYEFEGAIGLPIDPYDHYGQWVRCTHGNPMYVEGCGSPF
jgi:RHS repeat-associated protein